MKVLTLFPLVWYGLSVRGMLPHGCPSYNEYSQKPQGTPSNGTLGLPSMRPPPNCRTFNSSSVEKVIQDMKVRLKDPDVAQLFENTFPNTLDTTVSYYSKDQNVAFIITGDITAEWLRDACNQFAHYTPLLPHDPELKSLVKAIINQQARYVSEYPYCGAFQPPPESGLQPSHNDWADGVIVNPPVNNQTVFECKYELDSLAGFLKLSRRYYQATNDSSFIDSNWSSALDQVFRVIVEQSQSSFDDNYNWISYYNWTGTPGKSFSPQVPNDGNGELKKYTGMVGTHHRPSDDISIYAFLTSANAMLSVELSEIANMLDSAKQARNVSELAREWSSRIKKAIYANTLEHNIFAYETDGFGGRVIMDDANVPSLLSLPYLGFLEKGDKAYVATRKAIMSNKNPYYAEGKVFSGVGGPHVDPLHPWPMSHISLIYGLDSDIEISKHLYLTVNNTAGLGLIHESQSIMNSSDYTRPWFAWANSYWSEMVLDLAKRKPHLIFKDNMTQPYIPFA